MKLARAVRFDDFQKQTLPPTRRARSNSPKPQPAPLVLGYAQNKDEEAFLLSEGVARIWLKGRGAECLTEVLRAFRGRSGVLAIASDLRTICNSAQPRRPDIVAALASMEKAKITIRDYRVPEDTHAELQDDAFKAVAKREGSKGGAAKGLAAAARRNAEVSDKIARNICSHPKLNWKDRAGILGMSVASIHRHYS